MPEPHSCDDSCLFIRVPQGAQMDGQTSPESEGLPRSNQRIHWLRAVCGLSGEFARGRVPEILYSEMSFLRVIDMLDRFKHMKRQAKIA